MEIQVAGLMFDISQLFVTLGILCCLFEVFVPGFVLLPIGIAFFTSSLFTGLGTTWPHQIFIFAANVLAVFLVFQIVIKPRLEVRKYKTNTDAMIGKEAEVTEAVTTKKNGYIRLYGDYWEAIGLDGAEFQVGETVIIVKLDGNKAIVSSLG